MKARNYIAELIKPLNPSEKGYLKKLFNAKQNHSMLKLFQSLEEELKLSSTLHVRHTDEDLNNLLQLILEGLESYHAGPASEARSLLNQIEILTEKNLYHQAEKLIQKAKALCIKNELNEQLSELIEWEVSLQGNKAPTEENEKKFESLFEETFEIITKQKKELKSKGDLHE